MQKFNLKTTIRGRKNRNEQFKKISKNCKIEWITKPKPSRKFRENTRQITESCAVTLCTSVEFLRIKKTNEIFHNILKSSHTRTKY
jgi:hypothetical protein